MFFFHRQTTIFDQNFPTNKLSYKAEIFNSSVCLIKLFRMLKEVYENTSDGKQ